MAKQHLEQQVLNTATLLAVGLAGVLEALGH
jgi:hypothetical protein